MIPGLDRHTSSNKTTRFSPGLLLLIGLLCFPAFCLGGSRDFEAEVQAAMPKYEAAAERQLDLFLAGRMDEAFGLLTDLVPDEKKGPADYFILGNMLYSLDPGLSREFHRRAYEAKPKVVPVMLEHALQLHRHGQYVEAAKLYRKVVKKEKSLDHYHALASDCLFRTGDVKSAIGLWKASGFMFGHTDIDFAIHSIYGETDPWVRRADLLHRLESDPAAAAELILLDLSWDTDWWNTATNHDALNHDMALLEKKLGADSWRFTDLETLVYLATSEGLSDNMAGRKLKANGLILDGGRLLQDSAVTAALISRIMKRKLTTHAELYQAFGEDLEKRARSEAGDLEALNILAALVIDADSEKLEAIDRYGWERYGDERFACSLLRGKGDGLQLKDPDLQKALKQFPEGPDLHFMALGCAAREEAPTRELLVALIKAEFSGLESELGRFSQRLSLYIATLDQVIRQGLK